MHQEGNHKIFSNLAHRTILNRSKTQNWQGSFQANDDKEGRKNLRMYVLDYVAAFDSFLF